MTPISHSPPLRGFGLPLDHDPPAGKKRGLFPTALDPGLFGLAHDSRLPALTLRELEMLQFMDQITDKKDWETKVFDEVITQKWMTEVLQDEDLDFTKEMVNYCVEELKYKATLYKQTGLISIYNGDVVKSDTAIPADLQTALKAAVALLENVPEHKRDWHPGSNEQVLDLVHPSLFPLVYGVSRILVDNTVGLENCITCCGQGEVIPDPMGDETTIFSGDRQAYSRKFQWLPCDVDISGDIPKIASYINNLHPKDHEELYLIIEKIMARVIPLWNATLTPLLNLDFPRRIRYDYVDYDNEGFEDFVEKEGPKQQEGEGDDDYEYLLEEWKYDHKPNFLVKPNPKPFTPGVRSPSDDQVDLKKDYGDTGLQVIVKLANIYLTPEKPSYGGGTWHVEGQLNEHICATAIYYYGCENITSSRLAFRQAVDIEEIEQNIPYEQNDNEWLPTVFGIENQGSAVQQVGSVEAREGRLITFPNVLQHRVQPFKLADPTKPGHRKILAFFLVDPHIKVISTANIPCQQRDWWGRMVTSDRSMLARLPVELRDKVIQGVEDFPISLEQAKKLREELIEERKEYEIKYQDYNFNNLLISLCEH